MKKSILTMLVLLICAIQTTTAYEYFTIYFNDGTKSEAFYATDVDSICYSKLSLDSIAYDDWQVQEIYTCDSIYRYSLAQIDSLSFKDVDENIVAADINRASSVIVPLYAQYESAADLSQHLSIIRNVEGVENAWVDGQALYVYIRDYGTITFIYPPKLSLSDASRARAMQMTSSKSAFTSIEHNQTDIGRVCIFNHMAKDDDHGFDDARWVVKELKEMYDKMGILCDVPDKIQADFFVNQMFDYDQLFLITHGEYDSEKKSHWLATDEEILCVKKGEYDTNEEIIHEFLKSHLSTNKMRITSHREIRNKKDTCIVFYVAVSENLIASSKHHFKNPNTIVFNAACQSMGKTLIDNKKLLDYNMGNTFINKGAICYVGYDDSNTIGRVGGFEFFQALLNGSCTKSAFDLVEDYFKTQDIHEYKNVHGYNELNHIYSPEIRVINKNTNLCFFHPQTLDYKIISKESGKIEIKAQIKKINSDSIYAFSDYTLRSLKDKYTYGFQYSTNSDMSGAEDIEADTRTYDEATLYMNWEATLDNSNLKPNTTYYYRAYMNDGFSNCYGEIKEISNKVPYAVLDGNTFAFYYDGKQNERNGVVFSINKKNTYYSWEDNEQVRNQTTKVVFDSSFAEFYPDRLDCWFAGFQNLTTIENVENLKTDSVTTMYLMFCGCSSIKKLDLSSFNTSKVRMMVRMFQACSSLQDLNIHNFTFPEYIEMLFDSCPELEKIDVGNANTDNIKDFSRLFRGLLSLKSIDLSSFNTKQATNMSSMFGSCSSLVSLDLSHFDTSNVTDMSYMFSGCSQLTALDISHFNTSNVTNMSLMFNWCRSLTALDVSQFNTDNVTNMSGMFGGCSQMETLDFSSFNTSNVSNMSEMFAGCNHLKELNASHFNTNKVTNMSGMFRGCIQLTALDVSSFNTSNVTDMSGMFSGCNILEDIDLSHFNTEKVVSMSNMFNSCEKVEYLDVSSFDTSNVTDMSRMFVYCRSLSSLDISHFDMSNVKKGYDFWRCESLKSLNMSNYYASESTDVNEMFRGCSSLETLDMSNFYAPSAKDMSYMFSLPTLKSINLTNFKTDSVTNMNGMFALCNTLNELDLTSFSTLSITDMSRMFENCSSLSNLNLSSFNTSNVMNMSFMFRGCSSLTDVTLSSFSTGKVTNMEYMFYNCKSLTSLDVSNFNVSNIEGDGLSYMFDGCKNMKRINMFTINAPKITSLNGFFRDCIALENLDLKNISIPLCKSISSFIYDCESLKTLDMSNFNAPSATNFYGFIGYHPHLKELNLSNMTIPNAQEVSLGSYDSLKVVNLSNFKVPDSWIKMVNHHLIWFNEADSLNISNFNTNNLTRLSINSWAGGISRGKVKKLNMSNFSALHLIEFEESYLDSLTYVDINNFNAPELEKINGQMFRYVETFDINDMYAPRLDLLGNLIPNCEVLKMNNCHVGVSDAVFLFGYNKQIKHIYLSGFSAPNLTTTKEMFFNYHHLQSIEISNFSCSNVTNMREMFYGCNSLKSLNLSGFDTSNVTDMEGMFKGCYSLTNMNLSNFDTSNVTNMKEMFYGCSSLKRLDLSSFNVSNVHTNYMFSDCSSLNTIYANNWNCDGYDMFLRCEKLVGGKGTKIGDNIFYNEYNWPSSYHCFDDSSAAHIDGGKDNPGLFTAK